MRKRVRELSRQYNAFTWYRRVMRARMSLQESMGERRNLDSDIQRTWAQNAKEENKRIRGEKTALGRLVSADKAAGPFGSVDKTCPIILSELTELLHNDDGYLENLFRDDSIDDWEKTLDAVTKCHVPTKRASGNLRETIIPGERCAKCRSFRQTWLSVLLPLRADVRYYYKMFNGAAYGLTTCLVWGDKSYWFEAALLFGQPELILGIPIDVVRDKDELVDGLFGTYPAPESCYLELPDIFPGCSFDLINFCMGRDRGCPPYFIFGRKAIVTIQDKGWWAYLHSFSTPVARDDVEVKAHLAEKKRNQKKRPPSGG